MNIQKLNEALDSTKRSLGNALIATDIYTTDEGTSIAAFNTQPKACALFNEVTTNLKNSLSTTGFPGLNEYYLLELKDGHLVVILNFSDYQWVFLVDSKIVKFGILFNVIIPEAQASFLDAVAG